MRSIYCDGCGVKIELSMLRISVELSAPKGVEAPNYDFDSVECMTRVVSEAVSQVKTRAKADS